MGDAAGIGPELIVKSLQQKQTTADLDALVIGDAVIMEQAIRALGTDLKINVCASPSDADFSEKLINVIDMKLLEASDFAKGEVNAKTGKAAVLYTEKAVQMAIDHQIDAIASAPVNKEAMHLAGYDFAGVTELVAHLTKTEKFAMVLVFGPIRLFYVANHISMKKVFDSIKKDIILEKIQVVNRSLGDFGIEHGKIAVAAFNPHGGEGGAMGDEEINEIIPAIDAAKAKGIDALGPFPADTIFINGREGEFDAILAMYHDQGNIAAKLMDFGAGVTVVAGLPIIRTSVAHGTAFDIAGKGIAIPDTYITAIKTASQIAIKQGFVH